MGDRPVSVLHLVGDPSGCTVWRCWHPVTELDRRGYPVGWEHNERPTLAIVAPVFDAYVLHRLSWKGDDYEAGRKWVDTMHKAGKCVIYESDDDLFSPWIVPQQKASVQRDASLAQLEEERMARVRALQLCDGVTVSTPRLATVVRQYVSADTPVIVVPNLLDWRWFRAVQRAGGPKPKYGRTGATDTVVIGWAGGTRPDSDLASMARAWGQVVQRYRNVHFVVQGHQPEIIGEYVPKHRITRIEWLPLKSYPLGMRGIDIGCAPLVDRPFNRCKTPIKAMEYAASGAAVVASPTVYSSIIQDGVDGALVRTADDWEYALGRLVEDAGLRKTWARALRRKVAAQHSLERQVWRWPAAWEQILEHYRQRGQRLLRVS